MHLNLHENDKIIVKDKCLNSEKVEIIANLSNTREFEIIHLG